MRRVTNTAAADLSVSPSFQSTPALTSIFGGDAERALQAVGNFTGQKRQHAIESQPPGHAPERHREDMYRTFRGGEPVVPSYVAEHFARTKTTPPRATAASSLDAAAEAAPEQQPDQPPQLITDHWLHSFVKWHVEMEGIPPHADTTSPVYFKLSDTEWVEMDTSWAIIDAKRRTTGLTGLNEFVTSNGYEPLPAQQPVLPAAPNPVSDHWLRTFAIWHFEKKGKYPGSRSETPVYFKLEQPGQPAEWVETGMEWADLNEARILSGQSSLNDFIAALGGTREKIADSAAPATLHNRSLPLGDARLKQLMEWHHEKEGHYPRLDSTTPVWAKDEIGNWLKTNDSWNAINAAMARRGRGVESPATSIRKFLKLHGYLEASTPREKKAQVPRDLKADFNAADTQEVAPPAQPAAQRSGDHDFKSVYIDYLLEKFRTRERRDPDLAIGRDRVWDTDAAGRWVEMPFNWILVDTALNTRIYGVDSAATSLKGHIRRQLPAITPAYLASLLTLHQTLENRPLKTDPVSLNQHVWMENPGAAPYKSAIRWNLFAEYLKSPEAAAAFGTNDLSVFVQRHLAAGTGRRHPSLHAA